MLTYLHNLYTASKDGVETTGNAVRGYASIPTVGVTNLFVLPGARSFEEILRDTKRRVIRYGCYGASHCESHIW